MENADTNVQDAAPELQFKVDREKALQLGVSFSDIANTINTATNGTLSSYYQEARLPVSDLCPGAGGPTQDRGRYPEPADRPVQSAVTAGWKQRQAAFDLGVAGAVRQRGSGNYVLLRQVATPIYAIGPSEITRQNSQRYIAITGGHAGHARRARSRRI